MNTFIKNTLFVSNSLSSSTFLIHPSVDMSQQQSDYDKQYTRLITLLKRRCGKARPTVTMLEWAMDKLNLPEDFEVDYDELVLDLSCFELDAEQEQIRLVERRYKKMAMEAKP